MSYGSVNYGFPGEGGLGDAVVVPRVQRDPGAASQPIDRLILPLLRRGAFGIVLITAPPGGGKTTALRFLQEMLPPEAGVQFYDEKHSAEAMEAARRGLVILAEAMAGRGEGGEEVLEHFELSPWTMDDCIEYLAGRHREQLKRIVKLLSKDDWMPTLAGSPQLLTMVMDAMAADASLRDVQDVLRGHLDGLDIAAEAMAPLLVECCRRVGIAVGQSANAGASAIEDSPYVRLLRHDAARRVMVAHAVATQLSLGEIPACLHAMAAKPVLGEIAAAVSARPAAGQTLERLIVDDRKHKAVAMAASILLRIRPDWRPEEGKRLNLAGADLRCAKWADLDMSYSVLAGADFSDADLAGVTITSAPGASFARACLKGAMLSDANLQEAKLTDADVTVAALHTCDLTRAECRGANFSAADLTRARLNRVDLDGANLMHACLRSASLWRTKVVGARFFAADLTKAHLRSVRMKEASWGSAIFRRARLRRCNLEGLELPDADFSKADCSGSLFTASRIPRGMFAGANLQKAGLAEIEWDDADLRDVDFTNASFHMGSARSGLVGSTIPGEGSRTGFYTDDFSEQDFKTPEEIRKACLCGANLVGALVEQTDFYLVDLRGAKYTKSQATHFRGCGAILIAKAG